jgi:DNA polymerase-3 subunit beta
LDKQGAKMVTTDGHRLAFVATKEIGKDLQGSGLDVLIPRKTLAELTKLTADFDGDINLGADENHVYFQIGSRLLISRMLSGQFPNYEMVMPKNNDRSAVFDTLGLNQAIRRVALMADDRSHAIRFHLSKEQLLISSQNAEEGEARETLETDFDGEETEIGFNAQYLQDFLNVVGTEKVAFEFKDGNSQAQLRPVSDDNRDYRYIIMPMRL